MNKKTFWDFCAPVYDIFEALNGRAYAGMLKNVQSLIPNGATVLETAAGTGSISLAVADKASRVLCTDISEQMLDRARRKAIKHRIQNIDFANRSIYSLGVEDASFDIVIAGQVLHLIDEPEKAAAELRRAAKQTVILPMSFTKDLRGIAKLNVSLYRMVGFSPKREFNREAYKHFLPSIGFEGCTYIAIDGKIPMMVAVWSK
ncbi:MAG: class I SAM-dependent methyltransferase [Spirochaetaceae bacterium]|jgi:ubiquinone/menaquinone biosynthesis C-methylase UbiE|nr:class I SAM-dependent methyltransferase [Spirochaetaceae bacterium]